MKRSNGFTLTEVLLAVMIVAIIGVALASLTTAASRESSLGNSRIILRNNLSAALRQIRADIQASNTDRIWVPMAGKEVDDIGTTTSFLLIRQGSEKYISYCVFLASQKAMAPDGATTGGILYRTEYDAEPPAEMCSEENLKEAQVLLTNVKFIPVGNGGGIKYEVPVALGINGGGIGIRIILEIPNSNPVVNVAAEEIFFGPSAIN